MKILILLLLLTGVFAGLIAGLLGIGGGVVVTPLLFLILSHFHIKHQEFISHIIFGSSNGIVFITSLRNFYNYYKNNLISIRNTIKIAIFCIIGGFCGGKLAEIFSSHFLKCVFGIFFLIISIIMFFSKEPNKDLSNYSPSSIKFSNFQIALIGLGVGCIAGFFGIGGGILVIPTLNLLFKIPIQFAQGFSVSLVPFNSFGGVTGYILGGMEKIGIDFPYLGFVNILIVGICSTMSIIFTKLGLNLAKKINKNFLKKIFALVLLITSLKFIFT